MHGSSAPGHELRQGPGGRGHRVHSTEHEAARRAKQADDANLFTDASFAGRPGAKDGYRAAWEMMENIKANPAYRKRGSSEATHSGSESTTEQTDQTESDDMMVRVRVKKKLCRVASLVCACLTCILLRILHLEIFFAILCTSTHVGARVRGRRLFQLQEGGIIRRPRYTHSPHV